MNTRKLLWLPVVVVVALTGFAVFAQTPSPAPAPAVAPAAAAPGTAVTIDLKAATAPRSLGKPDAPVKVDEYASLGCSHCAAFEKETFDKFKAMYIDTGKVFYTFHDFPLNAPALEAAMVSRCVPQDKYFDFVKFMFESQENWAFTEKYDAALRQNSKLVGMSDATFDACTKNDALKNAIVDGMQAAAKAPDKALRIEATPTFIINNTQAIPGAVPLPQLQAVIDPLVAAGGAKPK